MTTYAHVCVSVCVCVCVCGICVTFIYFTADFNEIDIKIHFQNDLKSCVEPWITQHHRKQLYLVYVSMY